MGASFKQPLDAEFAQRSLRSILAETTGIEELEDAAAATPLYWSLLQTDPKHAGTTFAVGRIMLEEGDARGLDLLEAAMKLDADAIIPACKLAYHYLSEADRLKVQAEAIRAKHARDN